MFSYLRVKTLKPQTGGAQVTGLLGSREKEEEEEEEEGEKNEGAGVA